jgi:glutamine amidotransferase-like uncharacterized protein
MSSLTLLDVIDTVAEYADTDDELKAVVTHLVNSGKVQLSGDFSGCKIDFGPDSGGEPVVVTSQTVPPQQELDQAG